jgi:hypothetical protein
MTQLNVLIDTPENATLLQKWLTHIDFVKGVGADTIHWSLPGRPASETEILQMIEECEDPMGETDADIFFEALHKNTAI